MRVVFTNPIPRNNKAPTYMLGLCFVWFGIRRTVYFGAARFSAGLEVGGKFGVPPPPKKLVTINKSANYGSRILDFLDVSTLSVT